jgi:hypothetical protein
MGRWALLLRGRESPRHQFLLRTRQLVTTGNGWPLPHGRYYLREHGLGLGRREPEIRRYLPGQVEVQRIISLRNVEFQALPVPDGIQVKGRREMPALGREQKAMITQVVVGIRHADVEHNAPPELRQILRDVGSLLHQQARQLQVAGSVLVVGAILVAQQGHGGGKVPPLAGRGAVKALGEVGVVATVEALGTPDRYL